MAAEQRVASVHIDPLSSESSKPYGIITADRGGTENFDDGIAVEPLASNEEMYCVSVFTVDTSQLYLDDGVVAAALERRETCLEYGPAGLIRRQPMIDDEYTRDLHFQAGRMPLNSLVVSFMVGKRCPPRDVRVGYGIVEVQRNHGYEQFGGMCRDRADYRRYGRAAVFLYKHLSARGDIDEERLYSDILSMCRSKAHSRGEALNRPYMFAANTLGGRTIRDEGRLAINRTHILHDRPNKSEPQPPAGYSIHPGPHDTLDFDAYTRITSPMRRLEDFINHGQFFLRDTNAQPGKRDFAILRAGLTALKQPASRPITQAS